MSKNCYYPCIDLLRLFVLENRTSGVLNADRNMRSINAFHFITGI